VVRFVVAARLEEEMARLARRHRDEPCDHRGHRWLDEDHDVGDDEAEGADEME